MRTAPKFEKVTFNSVKLGAKDSYESTVIAIGDRKNFEDELRELDLAKRENDSLKKTNERAKEKSSTQTSKESKNEKTPDGNLINFSFSWLNLILNQKKINIIEIRKEFEIEKETMATEIAALKRKVAELVQSFQNEKQKHKETKDELKQEVERF